VAPHDEATRRPDAAWLRAMPKAEVHVHLEGCIPDDVLPASARAMGPVRDLAGLLAHLDRACAHVVEPDQLATIARSLATRAARDGVGYTDAIVNPTHWPAWRGRLGALVDALDGGFTEAEADGLPPTALCISVKRSQSAAEAVDLVEQVVALGHPRVVALSIDGDEAATGRTGARFAAAFRLAAERGLHRCVHAGESSGPEGVRDALDHLLAERIDHGVRAVEDPDLVRELADRRIPLDVCPTSNVVLGLAASYADHPVERLRRAGVAVSLNTDDPLLFGCDVVGEYHRCTTTFGWTHAVVATVARTSITASFAPPAVRDALLAALDAHVDAVAPGTGDDPAPAPR
jgi:adenosine deaminase